MAKAINPFLMFPKDAEAAMQFYASLFLGAKIESNATAGKRSEPQLKNSRR